MPPPLPHVLVVGAGFAGLYAARELARHEVRTTLVDRNGFQTFQPLLYQVATATLPSRAVEYPIGEAHGVTSITGEVASIDLVGQRATMSCDTSIEYDYLVLATGAAVNFFDVPGAAEHALPLYTAANAAAIKQRLITLVDRAKSFSVAVIGSGPTGVEITGAICDVIHLAIPRSRPTFPADSVAIHLIDHATTPLSHFDERSQARARDVLEAAGVTMRMGTRVTAVAPTGLTLDSGTQLAADIVIWAGGLTATAPSLTPAPSTGAGGRITIDDTLRIAGHANVYCLGDTAADSKAPLPQLGSVAKQQGLHAAKNIRRQIRDEEPQDFAYRDLGEMAMIRHDQAVVEMGAQHHQVSGPTAYAMWLGLHAALLPDNGDRLHVIHDWIHEQISGKPEFLAEG